MKAAGGWSFTGCQKNSALLIIPGWFIMKVYSMTGAITIPPIWNPRCTPRQRMWRDSWRSIRRNRLSCANTRTPWGTPTEACTAISNFQRGTPATRADLSGTLWIRRYFGRTAMARNSLHTAVTAQSGRQTMISPATGSSMR